MRFLQVTQFDSLGDLNSWLKDRGERPDIVSIMPFMTGASGECRERPGRRLRVRLEERWSGFDLQMLPRRALGRRLAINE